MSTEQNIPPSPPPLAVPTWIQNAAKEIEERSYLHSYDIDNLGVREIIARHAPADAEGRALLEEALEKLDRYANRQRRVRMGARETDRDGNKQQTFINPNPNEGKQNPAVQSLMDRIRTHLTKTKQ